MQTKIAVDTCVLINFLCINRMNLMGRHPGLFLVTEDVVGEITDARESALYQEALSRNWVVEVAVTEEEVKIRDEVLQGELIPGTHMRKKPLGPGERSAIAVAMNRKHSLASDDEDAIRLIFDRATASEQQLPILRTQDIMVASIRNDDLSITEADRILVDWAQNHRFRLSIRSFRELL